MEGPLLDRSSWKARASLSVELDPMLDRVKTLARGGLTSMMVLGDFLRRCIAPLQQRSRMACMFTGVKDYSRIVHGADSDLSGTELEVLIRAMTGEAYTPESLVLPRGIKALCEDQALRTVVLASMPTLDEGGLAVRQVGGDPNHGIRIPGTSPDGQQRTVQSPDRSSHGGPATTGKGKGKKPELRHKYNTHSILIRKDDEERAIPIRKDDKERSIPIHKDDEVRKAATTRSSWDREEAKSRRLRRGDGSFVGEPAAKRQKTAESGGGGQSSSRAPPPSPQRQQPQGRPEETRRSSS
jgi:hypothetical protein